jgi:hypothetical protein
MRLKPHVRFWSRAGMVTFRLRQRHQGINALQLESRRSRLNGMTKMSKSSGDNEQEGNFLRGTLVPGKPGAVKACAAGRGAESVTQSREVRRNTSGPADLPESESQRGKEHVGKARDIRKRLWCRLARPARYGESYTA